MSENITCPACRSAKWSKTEQHQGYQLATCKKCGLTFTLNPNQATEHYVGIYEGDSTNPMSGEVSCTYDVPMQRLRLESQARIVPLPRLTPAEAAALHWLRRHAPAHASLIDCGCGTGRTLRAMKRAGFRPTGVEVSPELVATLNQLNLPAITGEAPDFPWHKEEPFAITFFEVLEHLANPEQEIAPLKKRFPHTYIIATVPSPYRVPVTVWRKREPTDYPPHHFLRWTPESLKVFFTRLGYSDVQIILPPPSGYEMIDIAPLLYRLVGFRKIFSRISSRPAPSSPTHSSTNAVAATTILWLHRLEQLVLELMGFPYALAMRELGATSGSMLVIARP
jgi:SAM-dependent methyltransferase